MGTPLPILDSEVLQQLKWSRKWPKMAEAALSHQIISKTASKLGLTIETEELQAAANSFRQQNGLLSAQETWEWLAKHGMSIDDLEALVAHAVRSAKVADHFFAHQVEPYFAEHAMDYAEVILYQVTLPNLNLAMELFYAVQGQELTFAEMARQYADDPEVQRSGGYRGMMTGKDLKPAIATTVFAATPPQLLRPIQRKGQFYLIYVEDIIRPVLDEDLRSQIQADLLANWLKQQINSYNPAQTRVLNT
jgi:parvulin-like peptidyl-prolyl isomerase